MDNLCFKKKSKLLFNPHVARVSNQILFSKNHKLIFGL
jgi:hypothetical protein